MAGKRFTDSYLIGLKPEATPFKRRDNADVKGFGIQVSTGGTKTFFLSCTISGKSTYINLGRYTPPIRKSDTNKEAAPSNLVERREYARKLRSLAENGEDPREWIRNQDDTTTKGSFDDLLGAYLTSLGFVSKATLEPMTLKARAMAESSMRRSAIHANQIFERDIKPSIDVTLPANAITAEMVTTALRKIVLRGALTQANRAHSYLHAAFQHGLEFDNDPSSGSDAMRFYLSVNPVTNVKRPQKNESEGETNLTANEIKILWKKLDSYSGMSVDSIAAIRLLLVTGQRVETVLEAPWDEFDFERQIWEIPAGRMKAKRSHVVPLHPMAIDILKRQIEIHDSTLVFPGGKNSEKPMINNSLSRAVSRFCEREKFKKFTPRDLRRTWKTRAGEIGISKSDRDRVQAHALRADVSSKNYDRYDYFTEKKAAMDAWCEYLHGLVTHSNVTPIRSKAKAV